MGFNDVDLFSADLISFNIGGRGFYPIDSNEKFNLTGKLGAHYWDATLDLSSTAINIANSNNIALPPTSESGVNVYVGAGMEYNFTSNLALRGEYTFLKIGGELGDAIGTNHIGTASIVWNF